MSGRWQYKVIEVGYKLFGGKTTDRVQAELDRMGAQGWELVAVVQTSLAEPLRIFFKKEA